MSDDTLNRPTYEQLHTELRRAKAKLGSFSFEEVQRLNADIEKLRAQLAEYEGGCSEHGPDCPYFKRTPDTPELPDDLIAAGTRAQWDWDGEAVDDRGAYYLGFVAGAKWQSEKAGAK